MILLAQGDPAATAALQCALELSHGLADQHLISISLTHLAVAHLRLDAVDQAAGLPAAAGRRPARVPGLVEEATIHRTLGELAGRRGQPAAAAEHRQRAIALFHKANATAEAVALSPARPESGQ